MNEYENALSLELIVRRALNCERGVFANEIIFRDNPILAAYLSLAPAYAHNQHRSEICNFIEAWCNIGSCANDRIGQYIVALKDINRMLYP